MSRTLAASLVCGGEGGTSCLALPLTLHPNMQSPVILLCDTSRSGAGKDNSGGMVSRSRERKRMCNNLSAHRIQSFQFGKPRKFGPQRMR